MHAGLDTATGRALVADEAHFIGDLRIVVVDHTEVIAPATDRPLVKCMSLLRRRAELSPEAFQREWRDAHAPLVRAVHGLRGYRQNLVIGRQVPKGTTVGYEGLPIDGIGESWFDSKDALAAALGSAQGRALVAHARTFVGEVTAFLVEVHTIV
jgi:uncharacterized protein (TIGR02118 family)